MRYLLAFFLPPLAVLSCGRPVAFVFNAVAYTLAWLTLALGFGFFFWLGCAAHACLDVSRFYADRRAKELTAAMRAALAPVTTPVKPTPPNYDQRRDVWKL